METGLAETLREMSQCIGRIEGKVDGIQEAQRAVAKAAEATNERVTAVERQIGHWKGWAMGVAAAVSFVIALVKDFLR